MKRRNFFGFAAGAAVAGPSMAKEAIGQVAELAQLSIGPGSNIPGGVGGMPMEAYANTLKQAVTFDQVARAKTILANIAGMSAAKRASLKRGVNVHQLDPDISTYRSIALHAKIDWQKQRQVDRVIEERRGMFQRIVDGLNDYDPDDIWPF